MDYLEARYYQAPLGRFISQDPILLGVPDTKILVDPQGLNYYGYSSDNPINKSDPSGKFAVGISVGSAVVEVGSGKSFMGLNLNLGVNYVKNSETSESWIVPTVSIGFTLKLGSLLNVNYPNTVNYPSLPSDDPPMVGGAYVGAGYIPNQFGISYTPKPNMTPADLKGESSNSSLNAAKISISAQVGADGTPTFSGGGSTVRAFGGGFSVSSYPVQTFTPLGSIKTSTPATTFWSGGVQYSSFTTVTTTQGPNNTVLTTTSANVSRVLK